MNFFLGIVGIIALIIVILFTLAVPIGIIMIGVEEQEPFVVISGVIAAGLVYGCCIIEVTYWLSK